MSTNDGATDVESWDIDDEIARGLFADLLPVTDEVNKIDSFLLDSLQDDDNGAADYLAAYLADVINMRRM
jgi:hypothetical protein